MIIIITIIIVIIIDIYIYSKLFKGVYDTFPYINWEMMPLPPLHRPFGASEISGASKWLVLHMETYN